MLNVNYDVFWFFKNKLKLRLWVPSYVKYDIHKLTLVGVANQALREAIDIPLATPLYIHPSIF